MKLLLINKYDNRILTSLDSEKGSANCLEKFTEVSEEVFEEYQASSGKLSNQPQASSAKRQASQPE